MIIGKYIRQLLTDKKVVVFPGFGSLQLQESGNPFPAEGGTLSPPGSSIRFDSGNRKDDGVLAEAYASGENIDEEESRQQVLELVDAIKFAFDKGESYLLTETGTLSRDEDGKVIFQIVPDWILEPDQYGLETMELLELDELEPPTIIKDKTDAEESLEEGTPEAKKSEAAPRPALTVLAPSPPPKTGSRMKRWRIIWITSGSLIVILLLLIFIPVNRDEGGGFKFGRNGIILKKTKVDPVVESSEADVNKEPEPDVLPETSDQADIEKETDSEEISSDEPSDNFFIIAGSFQHLRNASDLHNVLTGKGYPSEVIITENRLYRVSVISYATKEEATIGLRGIKAEAGLENCWLLSN